MYMRFKHPETSQFYDFVNDERIKHICSCTGTLAAIIAPDKSLHYVVTFQSVPVLHETYTIFGHVIHGFDVLKHIEYFGHRHTGCPSETLCVYETGSIIE